MTELPHILVVDDDRRIRTMLRKYLTDEGFRVSEAEDGTSMRATLAAGVDLVLLDLMLPGEDGLSLARYVRSESDIPVIILTGKGDVIDRVVGLETGADDYIAKPFHLREVLARIRTVMRRSRPRATAPAAHPPPDGPAAPGGAAAVAEAMTETAVFDGWRLDPLRRELRDQQGNLVRLTSGEFDLLSVFVRHPNRVLSRDRLMDLMKGRDWAAYDRTVDTQIVRLRRKIERDPAAPELIKTVRGAGYIFAASIRRGG
jgi:two-component system phosphate regulon response regulator OmpR